MLKQLIQCSLLAALLGLCSLAAADMELVEEAAEFERLTTRVTADGDGYINLRACDTCESQQLRLTEATRVFINGKGHHVTELNRGTVKFGTAFYDAKTMQVTRIVGSR